MILVIGPVRHDNPDVVAERLLEAEKFSAWLFVQRGDMVVNGPGVMHPFFQHLPFDVAERMNRMWCEKASELAVLKIDGWDKSAGLKNEMLWFGEHGKPVTSYVKTETGYVAQ
ncbi:MAG: DUF1937 family protein [Alphaproteobacteria bacterium]